MIGIFRFVFSHPLTRNSKLSAAARVIGWQIKSRLQDEVVVPWIGGTKLAVRKGMTGLTGNIYCGLHEFPEMGFLLHFLRPGDLFLDIGANAGSYSVLASGVCRARTFAFEPDPASVAHLRRNIELNGLEDRVTVLAIAVGAENGEVSFTVGLDTVNRVAAAGNRNSRKVPLKRLDDVVADAKPTMIKMDVEGYEDEAVRGAAKTLGTEYLQAILLETVNVAVRNELERLDFEQMYYDPFRRELSRSPTGLSASNSLFVRDVQAVTRRLAEAPRITILQHTI